jgi:hypothetical protein
VCVRERERERERACVRACVREEFVKSYSGQTKTDRQRQTDLNPKPKP